MQKHQAAIIKAIDLRIDKIFETLRDQKQQFLQHKNQIRKDFIQFRKETKNQNNDHRNELIQFRKEFKNQTSEIKRDVSQLINQIGIQHNDIKKDIWQFRKEVKKEINEIKKEVYQFKNEAEVQNNKLMQEILQLKKQTLSQNNEMKQYVSQLKNQNEQKHKKILNHSKILKQEMIIRNKINFTKQMVVSNLQLTVALGSKQLPFFTLQQFKIQNNHQFNQIEQKVCEILKNHVRDGQSVDKLHQQFISLEKQVEIIKRQFEFLSNNIQMLKINTISYLFPNKIRQLDLLYRASENNFQVSNFKQKCDGKRNTITIIKTQFGDVIGGYTPLPWHKTKHGQYQEDRTKQSFIFSLTNKHKLNLIDGQQKYAIYHDNSQGPRFGVGADLVIRDKANENNHSGAACGYTYNYNNCYGNNQKYMKLSGQYGYNFKIQQWQVYQIIF